jgi:glycopeptide antibiotics resistance protein
VILPWSPRHPLFKCRLLLLTHLIILVPLGYIVRFSKGFGPAWLNDALGGIAYEIFWIVFVLFLVPTVSIAKTAIGVCLATCAIEFLQLWQPPWLQEIRATLPGRLVLGNSFTLTDFPVYFLGSFAGWIWMRSLYKLPVFKVKRQHKTKSSDRS